MTSLQLSLWRELGESAKKTTRTKRLKTLPTINVYGRKFLVNIISRHFHTYSFEFSLSPKRKDMEKIVIIKSKWDL